jgi:hypothetical protein
MKTLITLALIILVASVVCGRASELVIDDFSHDGEISWTDLQGRGAYTIEWSHSLTQTNWSSDWTRLAHIPATGGVMHVRVPRFFRIRHVSGDAEPAVNKGASTSQAGVTRAPEPPSVAVHERMPAAERFSGEGSGSKADPYRVTTPEQLQELGESLSSHYVLTCDLDLSGTATWDGGKGFRPIGNRAQPFTGVFDGRGHKITGLRIARFGIVTADIGLFGATSPDSWIGNVTVQDAVVAGCDCVGILAGQSHGTVINCHVSGVVSGSGTFGGLAGANHGLISRCSATVGVRPLWVGNHLGGLVGVNNQGAIEDCFALGAVSGRENPGGLLGVNHGGSIVRCYACVQVESSLRGSNNRPGRAAGGLVAFHRGDGGIIRDCFAGGRVTAPVGLPVGSVVGMVGNQAAVTNSYALSAEPGPPETVGHLYADAGPVDCATVPLVRSALFGGPDAALPSWEFGRIWVEAPADRPALYPQLATRLAE